MLYRNYKRLLDNLVDFLGFINNNEYDVDSIKTVTLQVTNSCNLACTYCYQHNKNECFLTFDKAKRFIDALLNNEYKEICNVDKVNYLIFDFIGGEPFLAIDLMFEITNYIELKLARENSKYLNNHTYSISSNGTLYFTNKVQKYLDKYRNLVSVSITVDGDEKVHDSCRIYADDGRGSYKDAHAAAIAVKERYDERGTKITLAPANIQYLSDSFKYFFNEGYDTIHMNCVYEDVWNNSDAIKVLYEQTKSIADWILDNDIQVCCSFFDSDFSHITEETSNWCGGVGSMISISPEGNIYPCQRYAEISIPKESQTPYRIGNVDDGLLVTEQDKANLEALENITAWSCSDEECRKCPIASACGYCSAFNYEVFGTVNKRTKFTCNPHKARYLVAYYYYWTAELNKKNIQWSSTGMDKDLKLSIDEIEALLGKETADFYKELSLKVSSLKSEETDG